MPGAILLNEPQNNAIGCRLKDASTGAVFCAATYHMPCAFRMPAVMAVHMALCGQRAFALAAGDPFVLCGDFNVQPVRWRCCREGRSLL